MPQCIAPGCKSVSGEDPLKGVSLHRFPFHRPQLLQKWAENLGREKSTLPSSARLCSFHFLPRCFKETAPGQTRRLKHDAVPTEFVHQTTSPPHKRMRASVSTRTTGLQHAFKQESPNRIMRKKRTKTSQKSAVGEIPQLLSAAEMDPSKQTKEDTFSLHISGSEQEDILDPAFIAPTVAPSLTRKQKTPTKEKLASSTVTRSMLGIEIDDFPDVRLDVPSLPHRSVGQTAIPVPIIQYGTPRRTKRDHPYSAGIFRTQGTQTGRGTPLTAQGQPLQSMPTKSPKTPSSPMEPESDIEEYAEYLPSSSAESSSSGSPTKKHDFCQMQKFLAFEENLLQLMKFCKECGSPVVSCNSFTRGSLVGYKISCHHGHNYVWQSQPLQHRQPVGNLLIGASILISGNTYTKVKAFADMLKLQMISKSVYNKIQRERILPVIQEQWEAEKTKAIEELKARNHPIVLAGDARCDSPGHTAKYGSYTLMHTSGDGKPGTQQIVEMNLVQVSEVKNSNHMEPEGLERCLKDVAAKGLTVETLATDQHIMITSNMKKHHKEINHQFDVWHLAKGVTKKLTQAAKAKNCQDLSPWIHSVSNHLWWCCATCGGDEQVMGEKWLSLLHHATNKHKWSGNQKIHQCTHEKLSKVEENSKKWIIPTSPSFEALRKVISSKRLLNALAYLTKFCHTGELEVFHSMLLKYCPKRQHFHYDAMSARLMLAAIDWNNQKRKQQKDQSGKMATSVVYSKKRKTFVLRNRYGKIASSHMFEIIKRVNKVHRDRISLPQIQRPKDLAKNVAPISKPVKATLEARFKSRFK